MTSSTTRLESREPYALDPDQVFREHYPQVYRLALSMAGNPADAEDISQETFLAVFRGLKSFRGDALISTWIYRITVRVATRWLARRGPVREPSFTEGRADAPIPIDLNSALQRLPVTSRMIIGLVAVEGLSHREVAELLGIPEGTVASRLFTARKRLTELLGD
ncbi:MAG: sigma-70 family RNA polymerase sigma factor [Pseudomonadota bacterium]